MVRTICWRACWARDASKHPICPPRNKALQLTWYSAGIALYAVVVTIGAHLIVVRVEEPVLRERFGGSYEVYCQSVPRWFPKLRQGKSRGR